MPIYARNEDTWKEFHQQSKPQKSLGVQVDLLDPRDVLKYVPGTRLEEQAAYA
jgi:hypothetical protein